MTERGGPAEQRTTGPGASLLGWWAAALLCALTAAAQSPDGPTMYADFGWAGKIPGERWAPLTVWVQGGERALGGRIIVEFTQDATQNARVVTPFAVTPRERTPVPIVVALPTSCGEVTIRMENERGHELAQVVYARAPDDDQAMLPDILDPSVGVFVGAGHPSLTEAASYWSSRRTGPRDFQRDMYNATILTEAPSDAALAAAWSSAVPAAVDPALLPISWMAYDGVTVLAVDGPAAAKADPRALDAVRRWVEAGGRLVVLADDPGPDWRQWLPEGTPGDLLGAGAPQGGPIPGECLEAINAEALRDHARDRLATEDEGSFTPPLPPIVAPAPDAPYRTLSLTPRAEVEGWRLRWRTGAGFADAVLAEGPVGLGWVVVLGLDPRSVPGVLSARTSAAVWRNALAVPTRDWLEAAATPGSGLYGQASSESEQAVSTGLERLSGGASPGGGLFLAIAGCMLALAALVGPVDYLLLKRLGLAQRSWITALSWIGLASLAAYGAPRLVRDAPTQVARLTAIDRLVPRPNSPEATAPPTAWQTGLTAVFSGESGRLRFTNPDESAWWRGVSAFSLFQGAQFVTATVTTEQAAAGGAEGSARGNPLDAIGLSLWTFRAFVDQSRVTSGVTASVDSEPEGWRVRVSGLPEGASVRRALLRIGADRFMPVPLPPSTPGGSWEWLATGEPADDEVLGAWHRVGLGEGAYGGHGPTAFDRPGIATSLPGTAARSLAIEERLASGLSAVVQLDVDGWPTDTPVAGDALTPRVTVLRLVVPLDESDRVEATAPPPVARFASQSVRHRLSPGIRARPVAPPPPPQPGPMGPETPPADPPADPPEGF